MLSAETLLGHVIGDYRLKRVLGKGGASVVFLGERITSPQELVAVKVLLPPPSLSIDEVIECRRRFAREILTLRERLHSPSILPILASGEDPSTRYPYLVIPYISGGSLAERLASGALRLDKISDYVIQIAEVLDYAHSQQVIYRDLKAANVLVDEEDHVYLVDFGIAKIFDSALTKISQPGHAIGTPEYMAPEQALGAPVSSATDIYGLAVLTYTLVTGRLPFPPAPTEQMLMQVATLQPIPPRTFRSDLPEPAEAALLRALNKDPADRFVTACEFAQILAQGIEGQWPQGLHSQIETSFQTESPANPPLQASSPLQAEDNDQFDSQRQSTSFLVSPLSELTASSIMNNEAQGTPAVPLVKVLDQANSRLADKKRSPVLISRRMTLSGLVSLSFVGGGILWYLLNNPFAPPKKLKTISLSSMPGGAQQPPTNSTPISTPLTSTTQPTRPPTGKYPSTTRMVVPPLSVTIKNIPLQVMGGDTAPVVVMTSQPGISVTLRVTYNGPAPTFNSSLQITDAGKQATFSWPIPTFKRRRVVNATVGVTASDTQGQNAQSHLVQVQIMPT